MLTTSFGIGSAYFVRDLWKIKNIDLSIAVDIIFLYLATFLIIYIFLKKILPDVRLLRPKPLNNSGLILLGIGWLISVFLFVRQGVETEYLTERVSIPFSNLFLILLIIYPINLLRSGFNIFSYIVLLTTILTLALLQVRINLLLLMISFGFAWSSSNGHVKSLKLFFIIFLASIIMMLITFSRFSDDSVTDLLSLIVKIFASFGSEFRDGIFFHDRFTDNDIRTAKNYYFINYFTFFPGWSYIIPIDASDLRNAQLNTILSKDLGLFDSGVSGIRVGLLWEHYVFFGYLGIILTGIFSALICFLCEYFYKSHFYELAGICCCAMIYVFVGYPLFLVSNFGQQIFFCLFVLGLLEIMKHVKRN